MIDVRCSSGPISTPTSSRPTPTGRSATSPRCTSGRADQRRVFRHAARHPRLDRAGRRARRGDLRQADSRAARSARTATTASSGRWTRSRTAVARGAARVGPGTVAGRRTDVRADDRVMLPLGLARHAPVAPRARDRGTFRRPGDRLRCDAARADAGASGRRGALGRPRRARASAATRHARAPRRLLGAGRGADVEVHGFRDGYLPHIAAR